MEVYILQIVILEPEPELPHVLTFKHPESAREVYESYLEQLSGELPVNEFQASNETITEVIVPKFAAITLRHHPGEYQSTTGISGDDHRKHNQE